MRARSASAASASHSPPQPTPLQRPATYDLGIEAAAPTQRSLADAVRQRDRLQAARATQRVIERLDALQHEPPSRSGPELGLGL